MALMREGYVFDFGYTIKDISFGKSEDLDLIKWKFKNLGVMNPL
jgi:hypothetical protein